MNRKDLGRRQWRVEELATLARGCRPQGLNKADLVDLINERVGSPKKEAGEMVEAVFAIIRESLRHGSKVKISGFGSFIVNHTRAPRTRSTDRRPYHHLFPAGAILQAEPDPQGWRQQRLALEVTTNKIGFSAADCAFIRNKPMRKAIPLPFESASIG